MHCEVTLSSSLTCLHGCLLPRPGVIPPFHTLAPERESSRVSQSPIDFMACQSLPCPVESIAQCSINLPQEVGDSTLPSFLLLYSQQQDPGLSLALMGTASFLSSTSFWTSPSAFFPTTFGLEAGLGWDISLRLRKAGFSQ